MHRVQHTLSTSSTYNCFSSIHSHNTQLTPESSFSFQRVVLATGPGNPSVVLVWTAKPGRFRSRSSHQSDPLTLGGANLDPYPSICGFRRVWLGPSVPTSGSVFWVSHLWSHCDMQLWIVIYWHWYCTLCFQRLSRLDVQNKHSHAPNHILKMSVNRASTIYGLASSVIWVEVANNHP
jgi:hypothetical protein